MSQPSTDTPSVVDLLCEWADVQPDKVLYRFLRAGNHDGSNAKGSNREQSHDNKTLFAPISDASCLPESEGYTYRGLDRQARRIAVWLSQRVRPGECVVLAFPPGPEYLAAYFGCLYAGVIAVPAYPPRRNQRDARLCAIIADAEIKVGLTSTSLAASLQANAESADADDPWSVVTWCSIDAMDPNAADDWVRPDLDRDTTAFLQYTSGSTGSPKGVIVTHGNLLHNQHLIQSSFLSTGDDTVVGWLPLHHDMGLIGNSLNPLYLGGELIFMSPIDFLQKPSRWLHAITQFGGAVAGGPNFAYRLCVDEITDEELVGVDLSTWRVAFNGAEPIDSRVLHRFAERFADYGFEHKLFCPCYGMAETTLLVSSSVRGQPVRELPPRDATEDSDQSRSNWIGCGVPDESMDVRIVDPETRTEMPAGEIGEIWVAGPSVAAGYWKNPEKTRETFQATIAGQSKQYLRTGDLGLIDADTFPGELFVTGRCKDLIIVHGANHYPQDIERTAESAHPANAIGGGATFSVTADDGENVVITQEIRRSQRRSADLDEVIDAIRAAVTQEHQIVPSSIVLVRPGGIPKTTSGKVQRSEARRRFENDEFRILHRWDRPTASKTSDSPRSTQADSPQLSTITAWLIEKIAARVKLPIESIDVDEPVARYGLDSVGAVRLAGELSEWLDRDIPATLAYEYPTITGLANHLSGVDSSPALQKAHEKTTQSSHRHNEHHAGSSGPVAIVGIGCRFPSASNPHEFWNVLRDGIDATGECPHRSDWPSAGNLDPSVPTRGGYLADVAGFDAGFFGISPREADAIDPQHRLLLELTQEAFEDAGIPIANLSTRDQTEDHNQRVGVFVGIGNNDYSRFHSNDNDRVTAYTATGNSMAMAANRVSYTFDFRGPSLTIDTACSSSLVATHQAFRALGSGDCDYAIAAGVNLILSTDATESFTKAGMLSPSGICRTFDEAADGFVRGEGGGAVLLRPLSDALADGNRIYAVIQGSAVNQDGRSNGLTAPSRAAQAELIREALRDAGVPGEAIDYVEAHGTGTSLGDPIEVRAIRESLIETPEYSAKPDASLKIGSVKANIGHLEAAAGIAGLIKVALSVQNQMLPQQVNFETPTPHIDWSGGLQVVAESTPWPRHEERPRRAGVSSFGFGGTNAHVVLEEPPEAPTTAPEENVFAPGVLVCSAKSPETLSRVVDSVHAISDATDHASQAYTLATGRSHYRHRAAWVGDASSAPPGNASKWIQGVSQRDASVDWYFSGQGGCHAGAGHQLYQSNPTFRQEFDTVAEAFSAQTGHDLKQRLWSTKDQWLEVWIQPALYCLQVATARFWMALGVQPNRLVGHSLGEFAAACMAGVFTFEDGLTLVTRRAELTGRIEQRGGMLAVFSDEKSLRQTLANFNGRCEIAAVNGPKQTVVASLPETLTELADFLKTHGIVSRPMSTTHGFHSWLIEPILDEFEQTASMTAMMPPTPAFVSSQTGKLAGEAAATPEYWRSNLRNAVRFDLVLNEMSGATSSNDVPTKQSRSLGMEIGAGSTLSALARSAKTGLSVLAGFPADANAPVKKPGSYWDTLANLYVHGVDFDWAAALGGTAPLVSLPTYPFDRERHWLSSAGANSATSATLPSSTPETSAGDLASRLDLASEDIVFETHFGADSFLTDHRVDESVLFPAAGFVRWALAAGETLTRENEDSNDRGSIQLRDLEILRPLVLHDGQPQRCQLVLSPTSEADSTWHGRILGRKAKNWRLHATFTLSLKDNPAESPNPIANFTPRTDLIPSDVDEHYQRLQDADMQYGPAFRLIRNLGSLGNDAEAIVTSRETMSGDDTYRIGSLDACLQTVAACGVRWGQRAWVPVGIDSIDLIGDFFAGGPDTQFRVSARLLNHQEETATADLVIAPISTSTQTESVQTESSTGIIIRGLQLKATAPIDSTELTLQNRWVESIRQKEANSLNTVEIPTTINGVANDGLPSTILREISESLESVAGEWTIKILSQLGLRWDIGDTHSLNSILDAASIHPKHSRLLQRMLRIAEEQGLLQSGLNGDTETWTVATAPSLPTTLAKHPSATNEFALLDRCAAATADLMRSGDDPLPLLFPSDGEVSAADVYRDSVGGIRLNRLAAGVVAEITSELPPGRGLRVLEIGAGTGATTRAVLNELPHDRCEYVYTDVAPGFLAAARRSFAEHHFLDYRVLDIEQDPTSQGFTDSLNKFDIVIAANVLHATADLATAMRHIRSLIHPQGHLVVLEGTEPSRWLDLTFGLTPGWWRFTETDLRPEYPLISSQGWSRLLGAEGFDSPTFFDPATGQPESQTPAELATPSKVIVAQPTPTATPSHHRRWLLIDNDSTDVATCYANILRDRGDTSEVATLSELDHPQEGISKYLDDLQPTDIVVLSCNESLSSDDDISSDIQSRCNARCSDQSSDRCDTPADSLAKASVRMLSVFQTLLRAQSSRISTEPNLRVRWVTCGAVATDSIAPGAFCESTCNANSKTPVDIVGGSLWGMWRTLTLEQPQWSCSGIDLDRAASTETNANILFDEFSSTDPRNEEVTVRDGRRMVRQWEHHNLSDDEQCRILCINERGSLQGLSAESRNRRLPKADEVEVGIVSAGLNFRDVLNVLGAYPGNPPLGAECAGKVVRVGADVDDVTVGDRVVVVAAESIADYVTVPASSVCHLPESISFDDASTLPVAFLTASTAIEDIANLKAGESVLIHSAAGGVGIASVQIAQHLGAQVFATASLDKHDFLKQMGVTHVFDSRQTGYAAAISKATDGRGVDVIVNSLGEAFIDENLRTADDTCRYVDIALANSGINDRIKAQKPRIEYTPLDLSKRLADSPDGIQGRLDRLIQKVRKNVYRPLPLRAFEFDEVADAMAWLQSGTNIGKAVIHCGSKRQPASLPESTTRKSVDGLQIITGGLGGLGLLTAEHLIDSGATKIALLTRRAATNDENAVLNQWRSRGVSIQVENVQLSQIANVDQTLSRLRDNLGPITGVYHLAGVLDDATMEQQSPAKMHRVLDAKVSGAWNLHEATQHDAIDDFVLFSSFSAWLGSPGQANHAVANAFLDSLAMLRRELGQPAISIGWGPWGRIGAAAKRDRLGKGDLAGIGMLMPDEGIHVLEHLLRASAQESSPGSKTPASVAVARLHLDRLPDHLQSHRLFEGLLRDRNSSDNAATKPDWVEQLGELTADERLKMVTQHIRESIATALALGSADAVPLDQPLFDLGMDSLTSLELVNALQATLGVRISTIDLFNFPDVQALAGRMLELLSLTDAESSYTEERDVKQPTVEKHARENVNSDRELESGVSLSNLQANAPVASERVSDTEDTSGSEMPVAEVTDLLREIGDLSEQFEQWGADQ
ncbi:protein containing AMP-dependent synthetase and ligase [Rhodopirellula sallentina SM41]|uniref:Protein containing AMP-dependent synthetase and ligase n=1 Tax=Rhodopirellula sallentina SM41 TaxID=1263870 RepID=M5U9J0_9BACT|nr:protein containing AMP-dependent synthetase and ligase [Rhodopirellula sallentina SM41]